MLARSASRERELAVRSAIGASRVRLVRQLMTETSLLALLGGVAGVGLAFGVLAALRQIAPASALQLRDVRIDPSVLVFTLLAVTLSALLVGLIPALRARDTGIAGLLRSGDRSGSARRSPLWNGLVGLEIAMALVLLISCGLLVRSFREILSVDPGFDPRNVLAVDVFIPSSVHPTDTAVAQLETQLLDAVARVPGVAVAGIASALPGTYSLNGNVFIEGRPDEMSAQYRVASEGYFEAMRIPLVRGRLFDASDDLNGMTVALVDESFAAAAFGNDDPIGRRVRDLRNDSWYYGRDSWVTIVGVVGRVRPFGLLADAAPTIYVNYRQRALRAREATLTIRLNGARGPAVDQIRAAIRSTAPSTPFEITSASAQVGAGMADRRFALWVVAGFAIIALALAAVGIHSIVSWSVERRTREMGIRIALGAMPRGVALRIVREAMVVVAIGVLVGVPVALLAVRLIEGLLAGITPHEPVTIVLVVAVLGAVALFAALLPARRITRIDPILALRAE
jgi:putative ABC transport system permease protein